MKLFIPFLRIPQVLMAGTILRKTYPLQLTGFHYKARTHSSYGNIDVLQQACPQEVDQPY